MWIVWVVFGAVSAAAIGIARTVRTRSARSKRLRQDATVDPERSHVPAPGTDEPARRPDGSPVPGSEEYRNRQGRR